MPSKPLIFFCITTFLSVTSLSANAIEFPVDTTDDTVDIANGDGLCETATNNCSLRAAIQEANALTGADTITLPPGIYPLTISGSGEDFSATGDLDITSNITINGAGADQVFIDAMEIDRVFDIIHNNALSILGEATLNGLTIRNGKTNNSGMGGGINNRGILILNDSNVDRNHSMPGGGGIHAAFFGFPLRGRLEINRSVISNNATQSQGGGLVIDNMPTIIRDSVIRDNWNRFDPPPIFGGGIYFVANGFPATTSLEIYNSTIHHNVASNLGGGIYTVGAGAITIENSTISGNSATSTAATEGYGGGAYFFGDNTSPANILLTHVTFADNSAGNGGGGIYLANSNASGGAAVTLSGALFSANIGGNCLNADAAGISTLTESATSLSSDDSCAMTLSNTDPLLAVLSDNSGPGPTHALSAGSPAIDAASNCLATDQRSFTRPASNCDIGAYEVEGVAPSIAVTIPAANTGVSTNTSGNSAPVAYDLPAAVIVGSAVTSIMNASDVDGDPLYYEFPLTPPTQGSVGRPAAGSVNNIAQAFTYTALGSATGTDFFTYRACDAYGACSAPATIHITINPGSASSEISINVTQGSGNVNDLVIISETSLNTVAPDIDYSYPLGGFFFTVDNIPTDSSGTATSVSVTIQLPLTADLPENAEVRKLDNSGVWRTLSSTPNTILSTAVIDRTARTITLTLVDNDIYDLNPLIGVVDDPVAIGLPVAAIQEDASTPSEKSPATATTGSGSLGYWSLSLMFLLGLIARRNSSRAF
ncbi:MAG: Ig-like domain-containing protein [Gammaproteobacteria bacterium]|nr:Ig-like domain-containing protein [Gammaproteobacteria bacterium]